MMKFFQVLRGDLLLSLLLLFLFNQHVLAEEEFLLPEKAFKLDKVEVVNVEEKSYQLKVHWKIADKYYLYKDKTSFSSSDKDIKLGSLILPAGKIKNDEFFGEIEVYKKALVATLPVSSSRYGEKLTITAKTQGCAEAGICYPPFRQTINFTLPRALKNSPEKNKLIEIEQVESLKTSSSSSVTKSNPLASLLTESNDSFGSNGEEEYLLPEEAFNLSFDKNEQGQLTANWIIAPKYYLYQNKFKFEVLPSVENSIAAIDYPQAKQKTDDLLGTYQVYYKQVSIVIPLQKAIQPQQNLKLKVTYQGCAEAGLCYPVMKKTIDIDVASLTLQTTKISSNTQSSTPNSTNSSAMVMGDLSEQDQLASILSDGNSFLVLLTFFGLGLALAFTPCVFPMIPILSGIIAGHGDSITTRKAFTMSLLYVLAMAVTYTIAGVIAGLSGESIQIWFQNPWVLSAFAGVFVLLALSMFGFYELQLPSSLQSKVTEFSNKQKGGSYTGVIIMGFLSALIVGPCVAPPLMGALIYISQTGDPYLGGGALFFLSMGMGLPLIAIGTSAGKFLPRAGGWMDNVKVFFGIMMLAMAVWMLERVFEPIVIMWLWALILIYSSIYLGALTPIAETTTGWGRFRKSSGLVLLLYGVILIIGASQGQDDIFTPLKGNSVQMVAGSTATVQHLEFKTVVTNQELDDALAAAKKAGKTAMLDYYADWCISCKELEKFTFQDPAVIKTLQNTVLIQADVTKDNSETKHLMKRYKIIGPPAILFFSAKGDEVKRFRLVGYKDAEQFKQHLANFFTSVK